MASQRQPLLGDVISIPFPRCGYPCQCQGKFESIESAAFADSLEDCFLKKGGPSPSTIEGQDMAAGKAAAW